MARKPLDYWEKRQTELMKRLEKGTEKTINSLIEVYEQATKNINKEISNIFKNYAKDSKLEKKTLLQLLSKKETDIHYKNLLEVINNNITDDEIKKKLLAKYNAPAYSYRISRYQALQENIDIELKKLANIEQQITEVRYIDTVNEAYYRNIFNVQQNLGFAFSFAQIDNRMIKLLLNENWTNKANYSKRIWNNSEKLGNYLKTQLTADTMSGKSIAKMSKELSEYMNVGLYNATTLVRTEVNHFANEAEMLSYEECGIEKYRFIATLDKITCDHCGSLDNKVFYVKDRKAGKNYPPIHPNDRCTTVAEFDDENIEDLTRRARDENGKAILVPQDMNYQEWENKYINKELEFEDVTNTVLTKNKKEYKVEEQKYFIDEDGNRYNVDGINVKIKANEKERAVADLMGEIYGGQVNLVPVVLNPKRIKTPDYIINKEKFDLKEIFGNGKNTLDTAISKKKKQSSNFIFDISNTEMSETDAIKQIQRIYKSNNRTWVNKIILIDNNKVLKIYKRK